MAKVAYHVNYAGGGSGKITIQGVAADVFVYASVAAQATGAGYPPTPAPVAAAVAPTAAAGTTDAPTAAPTDAPSLAPTDAPSTKSPTNNGTVIPTTAPTTAAPSESPTHAPSAPPTFAWQGAGAADACADVRVPQEFSVDFTNVDPLPASARADAQTLKHGRAQARLLSGNPGYDEGLPLLAGRAVSCCETSTCPPAVCAADVATYPSAIAAQKDGLSIALPGPGGACLSAGQLADMRWATARPDNSSFPQAFARVNFGEDLVLSCTHEFTLGEFKEHLKESPGADFASFCKSDKVQEVLPELYTSPATGAGTVSGATRIGIYGNSDPLNEKEWLALEVVPATRTPVPDKFSLECGFIATSRVFEFLYTDIGSRINPQRRIVKARVTYKTDSWKWRGNPRDDAATQLFETTNIVRFIEFKQPKKSFVPRAPPLLPAIPHDVFYPFDIYGAAPGGAAPGGAALALALAAAVAVLGAWTRL